MGTPFITQLNPAKQPGALGSFGIAIAGVIFSAEMAPAAEFDLPQVISCHEVELPVDSHLLSGDRVMEAVVQLSVRFQKDEPQQIEEIHVELDGSIDGMQVYSFSPETELHSDHADSINNTVTRESAKSFDATLGGALPIGSLVAHVTPSVGAGMQNRTVQTETTKHLPPMRPLIVSGTTNANQGVFFKLKRSPQTTLEGVHRLTVRWVVPADWESSTVRVSCIAHGERKILWLKTDDTFGVKNTLVHLYESGDATARDLAQQKAEEMRTVSCCKKVTRPK